MANQKVKIETNVCPYPMPMCLVGAVVDGKPNFMPLAWWARANYKPPIFMIAFGRGHHTNNGIRFNETFSINIPGKNLMEKTDYCGLVSGFKKDKSKVFEVFYGGLKSAPMIEECPLCYELKLVKTVSLEMNDLFFGEVVAAYADEETLTDGLPDIVKMNPFVLTMPDNHYWLVGRQAGRAWGEGRRIIEEELTVEGEGEGD